MPKTVHTIFYPKTLFSSNYLLHTSPTQHCFATPSACSVVMKPTEAEKNVDAGKDVSHGSNAKPVEPEEHVHEFHQTVITESFLKEGENVDEKVIGLKSDNAGEVNEVSHESLVSDAGWACKSPNGGLSSAVSGWPSFNTKSSSNTHLLSAEERETVAELNLQLKALEACQEFLVGNAGSDCDEDVIDNEDEDEDELVDDDYDSEECEEYKFFEKVFREDDELRRYYENNYKEGHFYCLVCGAVLKKVWKRFKDCNQLVQHSTAVLRTKRRRAHRAYAQVICKIVGWDADQLPAAVSRDLDSSLAGSRKLLVDAKKPAGNPIDESNGEPGNTDDHVDDSVLVQ